MWLINSSIGRKFVMSITGIALVLFLLFHGTMNFVAILSPESYNAICHFLGANWYALVGTVGLALLVVLHFTFAFILTWQNYKARGRDRYDVASSRGEVRFEEYVCSRSDYHRFYAAASVQLLVQNAVCRNCTQDGWRHRRLVAGNRRSILHKCALCQSCILCDLSYLAGSYLVSPHTRCLECFAYVGTKQQNMVRSNQMYRQYRSHFGSVVVCSCCVTLRCPSYYERYNRLCLVINLFCNE